MGKGSSLSILDVLQLLPIFCIYVCTYVLTYVPAYTYTYYIHVYIV